MAAPTRANIAYYGCANPTPENDTDPLGGAIASGSELNPNDPGNLWATLSIGSSDVSVYSVHYRKAINTSSGSLEYSRFYNRAGMELNTGAGTASIQSDSADEDISVRVVGKVSSVWDTETLAVSGTSLVVGSKIWDATSVYRFECTAGTPVGLMTCSVNGEVVGVIYGTSDDPDDGDSESIACYMISAETRWALATAINTDKSSSNRLTAPSGLSSFSRATYWAGDDAAINVPGTTLGVNDYVCVVGVLDIKASIPQPVRNFQVLVTILGDSQA